MEYLLIPMALGLIPAAIAQSKGRSFGGWYIYGVLLWIVAMIHVLVIPTDHVALNARKVRGGAMKQCPDCAEAVLLEARVCRHCGHDFARNAEAGRLAADREAARIREESARYAARNQVADEEAET